MTMSAVEANVQSAQYVDFWNEILVPKFIKYKHILVDGLTHHSEAIFPSLPVKEGDRVLDIGCGFGDTAIKLARRVGQNGKVVGLDCCEAFLEYGRKDAAKVGGPKNFFFFCVGGRRDYHSNSHRRAA